MGFIPISRVREGPCPCDCADTGVIYCNASIEPYAAVNLLCKTCKGHNMVAVWQQGRWSNASGNAITAGYSNDNGKTWQQVPLPFTQCIEDGLPYNRAALGSVSIGVDGIAYATAVATNFEVVDAIAVASSKNGGKCWKNQQVLQEAPVQPSVPNLSTYTLSVTADPTIPKTAYVVWGRVNFLNNTSDAFISKTTNGGQSWIPPQNIHSSTNGDIGYNQLLISPVTRTLFHFFVQGSALNDNIQYFVQRFTVQGDTWSTPILIAETTRVSGVPFYAQTFGATRIRAGYVGLQAAINPVTNQLAIVFNQFANNTSSPIAITFSNDDGLTWSAPVQVSDSFNTPTFNSSVSYLSSGSTIGVSYYRVTQSTSQEALPIQYVFKYSTDQGVTFSEEIKVGPVFNLLTAPYSDGFYLGNYQKLLAVDNHFQGFFAATDRNTRSTKILTAQICKPLSNALLFNS